MHPEMIGTAHHFLELLHELAQNRYIIKGGLPSEPRPRRFRIARVYQPDQVLIELLDEDVRNRRRILSVHAFRDLEICDDETIDEHINSNRVLLVACLNRLLDK